VSLVLDTGVVLALLDGDDPDHDRCVRLVHNTRETLVVPEATLVEIDYWWRKPLGVAAWQTCAEDIDAGAYRLLALGSAGVRRAAELEAEYDDLGLGFVAASVVVTCELLDERTVATLDRRHFSVVVPRHCPSVEFLPA
jgi:predicted nucleic acid-binding protein